MGLSEILEAIGNVMSKEVLIANASAIITGITVIITGLVKSRKKTIIKVDNSSTDNELKDIKKENEELRKAVSDVLSVVNLMIQASKLDETTKFNANIICKGLDKELKEPEEVVVKEETSKTVVEKLSNELNK